MVTQTIVAEGDGMWREYVGGYSDWLVQRPAHRPLQRARGRGTRAPTSSDLSPPAASRRREGEAQVKLSFKEARDLESLPANSKRSNASSTRSPRR